MIALLFGAFLCGLVKGQDGNNGLEICINRAEAQECPGFYGRYNGNNRNVQINTDQLKVIDLNTNEEAYSIKLPGRYRLEFNDIRIVGKDIEFMAGDLRVDLVDIPVFGTIQAMPSLLPIPVTNVNQLLGFGRRQQFTRFCDEKSNRVEVDGQYCRYCDLCEVSAAVDNDLNKGPQKILPNVNAEGRFAGNCSTFRQGQRYRLLRTISLPEPQQAKSNLPPIERTLQGAFDKGQGRMVVRLRLLNAARSSQDSQCNRPVWCQFFSGSSQCQCQSSPGSSQNLQQQCSTSEGYMEGFQLAACYDIAFNYDAKVKDPNSNQVVCPRQVSHGLQVRSQEQQAPPPEETESVGDAAAVWDRSAVNGDRSAVTGDRSAAVGDRSSVIGDRSCNGNLWCCARPMRFYQDFGCPLNCVLKRPDQCGFQKLNN